MKTVKLNQRWCPTQWRSPSHKSLSSHWGRTKVPCDVECPKCNKVVRSKVTMVMGNCANICCCFICCLGGCCLGFIPWFCDYFKDAEHHCPVCKTFLGVSRKLKEAPFVKLWFSFSFKQYFFLTSFFKCCVFLCKLWFL